MSGKPSANVWWWVVVILTGLALGVANLIFGDLNQDEGWYLYAARMVAEGWMPYHHFAFTQGPALPLVYSLFYPLIEHQGVGAGRLVTLVFGLLSSLIAVALARKLGGKTAGYLALSLLLLNVYHSYFTTVVKTYSLTALFIMVGFYALARRSTSPLKSACWLVFAGLSLSAAASTRLSAGILLPVVALWLMAARRHWPSHGWLWFSLGGGAGLLALLLPFYMGAPEGFRFGLFEYHTQRQASDAASGLAFKAGFVSRVVQAYFVAALLVVALLAAKLGRPFKGTNTGYHETTVFSIVRLMGASALAMTIVHFSAPFPYDDYQVPVFPLVAVALGVSWAYALRAWSGMGYRWEDGIEPDDPPAATWFIWLVTLSGVAASFSSPLNQDWMISGRDRIWWNIKEKPALLQLREAARLIKADAVDGLLLTQDTYLAVEAGLAVPPGWEMGPFSYYPGLSMERARTLRLVNMDMMYNDLVTFPSRMAAFSGYGLAIASPEVVPLDREHQQQLRQLLERRYERVHEIPRFGQAATTLEIYRLKP